jgi:hypothetical protein
MLLGMPIVSLFSPHFMGLNLINFSAHLSDHGFKILKAGF